jgi:hypothetical protein
VGSSLVCRAGRLERDRHFHCRYNLGVATVHWLGIRGAGIDAITDLLNCIYTTPAVIVIHLGANDLGQKTIVDIVRSLDSMQDDIRARYPETRIVFSELIYRGVYRYSVNWRAMDNTRKRVNTALWALAPGRVIAHRNIDGTEGQLCTDKVHLTSEIGNVYFINNIYKFLQDMHSGPW